MNKHHSHCGPTRKQKKKPVSINLWAALITCIRGNDLSGNVLQCREGKVTSLQGDGQLFIIPVV